MSITNINRQKMQIPKGSVATVTRWKKKWFPFEFGQPKVGYVKWVKSGTVQDAVGDTIKIRFVLANLIWFEIYRCKWFSFSDSFTVISIKYA